MKTVYYIFLIASFALSLLSDNRKERSFYIFPFLLGLGLAAQLLEDKLEKVGMLHTFVFHIYNLLEYPLYVLYFLRLFNSKRVKFLLYGSVIFYLAYYFTYFTFFRSFWEESFGAISAAESILMVVFTLYFFYSLLKSDQYYYLPSYSHFYINTANLIFFSLSLFAMSFDSFLKENNPGLSDTVLYINRVSNILMYILYCIGFSCNIWAQKK